MKKILFIVFCTLLATISCKKQENIPAPDPDAPEVGTIVNKLIPESNNSQFTIPATQIYDEDVYPITSAPQWGSAVYPEQVVMKDLCAKIEFKIKSSSSTSVSKIELTAKAGEFIAGTFSMGFYNGAYNGTYVSRSGNSDKIEVVLNPAQPIAANSTITITVPVLGGGYAKGFEASIYNEAGQYVQSVFYTDGKSLDAGETYTLAVLDFKPGVPVVNLDDYDENIMFDTGLLSVGTYNILSSTGRSSCPNNTWDAARATISSIIMDMDCDVMSINELGSKEIEYLKTTLSGYSWVTYKNNGSTYSYAPGIIYKGSRLEKLSDGIFWLSDPEAKELITTRSAYSYTDPKDGIVYSASEIRVCVWAIFKDTVTGKEFCWFAPHPHIRSTDAQSSLANTTTCLNAGNIRSLVQQIPYVNIKNLPIVVAGDMNTRTGHVSYTEVLAKTGWVNTFDAAVDAMVMDPTTATRRGTNPGYAPDSYSYTETQRIDHVFIDGFTVKSYKTFFTTYLNTVDNLNYHPSDHLPIKVTIQYK